MDRLRQIVFICPLLFVAASVVTAYMYFMPPVSEKVHENIIKQTSVSITNDKPEAFIDNNTPDVELNESEKTTKRSSKTISFLKYKNNGDIVSVDKRRNWENSIQLSRVPGAVRDVNSNIPFSTANNKQHAFSSRTGVDNSIDDNSENDLHESQFENSTAQDTGSLEAAEDGFAYDISVSRSFMNGSMERGEVDVVLSVNVVDKAPNGLIVKEYIPEGWDILESTPAHKNIDSVSGEVTWLFIGARVKNVQIYYRIGKRDDAYYDTAFRGVFLYNDPDRGHLIMQIEDADRV